jgi:hypothetical protein
MKTTNCFFPRESFDLTTDIALARHHGSRRLSTLKRQARKQLRLRQNAWTRTETNPALTAIAIERGWMNSIMRQENAQRRRHAFRVVARSLDEIAAMVAEQFPAQPEPTNTRVVHVEFRKSGGEIKRYDLLVAA